MTATGYIDEAVEILEGEEVYRHRRPKPEVERAGYVKVPHAFTFYGGISPTAKIVYIAYRRFADINDDSHETRVGIAKLAKMMGMSTATMKRARAELVSSGLVSIVHRGFGRTRVVVIEDIDEHPEIKAIATSMLASRIRIKNDPNDTDDSIGIKNEPSLGSNMIPRLGSKMSRQSKKTLDKKTNEQEEDTPATREPSLQGELTALNGSVPTVSPSTEKRKRKPKGPKVTSVPPGDANNYHREMFAALAAMCVLDPNVKQVRGQLNAVSKQLRDAGYTVADLEKYKAWWKSQDWRGQRGDAPILGVIPAQILQAVQWVPQPAWTPALAKKNGPGLDTLRSWHKQHYYEQWNDHVAAELGVNPFTHGAFKEWYDNEALIPDDQLAAWYEQHLAASKENHQW